MSLFRRLHNWRAARRHAQAEQRAFAKIMCLMAALDAPPDIAADLRRIAREDLSK